MIQAPSPKIPFMFTILSLRSIRLAKHIFHISFIVLNEMGVEGYEDGGLEAVLVTPLYLQTVK
jgi:hypothetical protein